MCIRIIYVKVLYARIVFFCSVELLGCKIISHVCGQYLRVVSMFGLAPLILKSLVPHVEKTKICKQILYNERGHAV
jgi:uncharacterized membrane protein AbrB (regulator of aidB expression)